jgi:hypothetical protein
VPGPYILVSFHLAAYNLILYTQQYPRDVAGLVAVDPWYPTFYDYALGILGPVTPDTSDGKKQQINLLNDYKVNKNKDITWNTNPEFLDQRATDLEVLKVASLKNVPLTIIESETWINDNPDAEVNQANWEAIQQSNKDFCKLSSSCQMVKVPNSNFFTVANSNEVDKAIQELHDMAKK